MKRSDKLGEYEADVKREINMIKQMKQSACALAVLAATAMPVLADSVDVKVIGTIKPAACTPTLAGGGTIDYGVISPVSLSPTNYTVLEAKTTEFSITCDALARVAIRTINGRPSTVAGATENASTGFAQAPVALPALPGGSSRGVAGLGLDGTAKIGGWGLGFSVGAATADSKPVVVLGRNAGVSTWGVASAGSIFNPSGTTGWEISWGAPGTSTPVAFTTMTVPLNVQAYLNRTSELDMAKPITLDGMVTIELIYL